MSLVLIMSHMRIRREQHFRPLGRPNPVPGSSEDTLIRIQDGAGQNLIIQKYNLKGSTALIFFNENQFSLCGVCVWCVCGVCVCVSVSVPVCVSLTRCVCVSVCVCVMCH